ncbi:MAG: orotidine-5'-phosphate decarboxylase [Peptostreptococcales bacterium]
MMIIDKLYERVLKNGPVCIGLDPREELLPEYLMKKDWSMGEKIFEFNKMIIDATLDECACFKPQIACYEAFGLDGMLAYSKTVQYIKSKNGISIGDVKRGDISSTAEMYGKGHFEGDFEADFITLNPYMGCDSISPYNKYFESGQKGAFVLIKTSNIGSEDFQESMVDGKELYLKVGSKIKTWGESFVGRSGFSALGGVVGLTYPEEFKKIKDECKGLFYLIPGYGAQGGNGKDAADMIGEEMCGIVSSSRGVIGAHKGINEGESFAECARQAVLDMKGDILKWL